MGRGLRVAASLVGVLEPALEPALEVDLEPALEPALEVALESPWESALGSLLVTADLDGDLARGANFACFFGRAFDFEDEADDFLAALFRLGGSPSSLRLNAFLCTHL